MDSAVAGVVRLRSLELRGWGLPPADESSEWWSVDWSGAGTRFFLWLSPFAVWGGS